MCTVHAHISQTEVLVQQLLGVLNAKYLKKSIILIER